MAGETGAAGGEALGPLPGGHHGLSPQQVADSQRERLLAAIVTVVAAKGYRSATVTGIVKEASVSSRAFYEFYDDKEEALLAAFEVVLTHLEELLVEAAAEHPGDWPRQTVAVLSDLTRFLDAEPELARFCLLVPATASPEIIIHFRQSLLRGVPFLERGRAERADGPSLPASTEDSIIGGLLSLSTRAVTVGSPLGEILPELAEFALAPYLGADSARRMIEQALQKH
jgi:AcrR family transcriptional regulator